MRPWQTRLVACLLAWLLSAVSSGCREFDECARNAQCPPGEVCWVNDLGQEPLRVCVPEAYLSDAAPLDAFQDATTADTLDVGFDADDTGMDVPGIDTPGNPVAESDPTTDGDDANVSHADEGINDAAADPPPDDANDGQDDTDDAGEEADMEPPDPPAAESDSYALARGETLNVPSPGVLDNDESPTELALTAVVDSLPAHGSVTLNPDGAFTYTHDGGVATEDQFTYRAHDGSQSSEPATVSLSINIDPMAFGQITLGSELVIAQDVTFLGVGQDAVILSGNRAVRVLSVNSGVSLALFDLTSARRRSGRSVISAPRRQLESYLEEHDVRFIVVEHPRLVETVERRLGIVPLARFGTWRVYARAPPDGG